MFHVIQNGDQPIQVDDLVVTEGACWEHADLSFRRSTGLVDICIIWTWGCQTLQRTGIFTIGCGGDATRSMY